MRILGRYVFREILTSSLLAIALGTFIIFLQGLGRLFEILVRSVHNPQVALLFLLALPPVLILSIPFGVLVGILVGLGRLAADNEMTAMRSAGVSSRVVVAPVLLFAALATGVTATCALWLNPLAIQSEYRILNRIAATQLTAEVQPRVFEDQFTNDSTVLYVDDVKNDTGPASVWNGVFIADLTPPEQRNTGLKIANPGPRITVAREALAVADPKNNRIQLALRDYGTHEAPYHSIAPTGATMLQAAPRQQQQARRFQDMYTRQLIATVRQLPRSSPDGTDARIELQKRFALPVACLMLALVGIPLGAASRKGGRSAGYVWAVFLAFFCYYVSYITLTGLARSRSLSPEVASWLPNAIFGLAGLALIFRMETPGDRDWIGSVVQVFRDLVASVTGRFSMATFAAAAARKETAAFEPTRRRFSLVLFRIQDNYVLSAFIFYFIVWLCGWVAMVQIFTFFDLLSDIVKNNIPAAKVITYHVFLTPELIYDTVPESILLAVLITFGVMTRNNEVTAFKACGVSVRRLAVPVIVASALISVGMFAFNYSWLPRANQVQDAIRNEIKGRPVQTYLHPQRKWVIHDYRIFYFKYFDPVETVMAEPYVFEIDPRNFHVVRQISANRARWQQSIRSWVWEQGTVRDICGVDECKVQNFTVTAFPEVAEVPEDFLKEVKQDKQMNYLELERYIDDLQAAGFDTIRLRVQYFRKFSVPLFGLIMAALSVPFGFMVGNRGAMAGVGVAIAVAMAYLGVTQLFEQIGNVGYLPPEVAAWSPDALFAMAGLYLMLRMRS